MSSASAPYTQNQGQSQSNTDSPHEQCTCQYCDDEYRLVDGYNRNYCSLKCRYNSAAHGVIRTIRFDHRFCGSCFRKLKEIDAPVSNETPKKMSQRFRDADQWGTYHADECMGGRTGEETGIDESYHWGIGEEFTLADPVNGDWSNTTTGGQKTTKVCECGVTHHSTVAYGARKSTDDVKNFRQNLSKSELNRRADRLVDVITQHREEERHGWDFDRTALFTKIESMKTHDELCNAGVDYDILEWSLGHAIRVA